MSLEEKGSLSINSENLFPIIKKWLYSDQDIFIRELVSNAVDAIQKLKHLASLGEITADDAPYQVTIHLDPKEKTITISDNGIGMTADEVKKYINQIAFSGAAEFMEKYKDSSEDPIIGHFGLGFYSAFMVSALVEIQTLSYQEGAEAVCWTCDGSSTFEMTTGSRTARGTDIILHVNEDGEKYLQKYEMQAIANKYCSFMAVPVYLTSAEDASSAGKTDEGSSSDEAAPEAPAPINETAPLWLKNPKDCTDEEYKDFYHKVFMDFKEPLFWIHLNMDYPFNLKGILYFPKLGNEFESAEGQVKLYCNQVFVADNVKEIIPEFLLLLKGAIDCPDIPLNVSRSFLQNDGYVRKISEYITKKVADKLSQLYTKDRENYEKYWADIHPFIKYGCLRNEKFYDRVKDSIIYHSMNENKFITLTEYLEAAKETHENKVFYTTDPRQQAQYLQILKQQNMDAVELGTAIDSPFISLLESKNQDLHFLRVDADLNEILKDQDTTIAEKDQQNAEKLFREFLSNDQLKVRLESLRDEKVSAIIEMTEDARRMQEMMKMYGAMGLGSMPQQADETLVLNMNNPLIAYILDHPKAEKTAALAQQIYDLARLSHAPLSAEALTSFLARSQDLLQDLI